MIYRGQEPQRKLLIWLAIGLVGVCLIGLFMRGPEPFVLGALFLSPVCVFAYYLFVIWGQRRVRRVDLDGGDLVLREGFGKERRVSLADLSEWGLLDIPLYSTGISYDSNQPIQIETGAEVKGPALTTREAQTGKRIELVIEDARIDIETFRALAPDAVAELEKRAARKGKAHLRFRTMTADR